MRHYLTNLLMNIYGKKWIVYQVQTLGIQSLLVLIQFKLDQIVHDRPNIPVTYFYGDWHERVKYQWLLGEHSENTPKCDLKYVLKILRYDLSTFFL